MLNANLLGYSNMSEFNLHELPDENFESMSLDQLGILVLRHSADNSE